MLRYYTAVMSLSTIWSHPIWLAARWIKGFSKLTVVVLKSQCDMVLRFLTAETCHVCLSHNTHAQKSCCPFAHSVFFHTWLAERGKGEDSSSTTDLRSWVRSVSSVINFTDFIKVPGFGIRIKYNLWEWRSQSSLSGWRTGTITQNQ